MKIVMLHNWPFIDECGWLAKYTPNIYIDTCWQPVLSPGFFDRAMRQWLTYVPTGKIMCSHDSTSVEMAVGSSLFTREILASAIEDAARAAHLSVDKLDRLAVGLLHDNAAGVYSTDRLG
jgi:predicted TIM-barrel fold metal-dependent hydrolase